MPLLPAQSVGGLKQPDIVSEADGSPLSAPVSSQSVQSQSDLGKFGGSLESVRMFQRADGQIVEEKDAGRDGRPVDLWRDSDGDTLTVADGEEDDFLDSLVDSGRTAERVRVVRDEGTLLTVPDSERTAYLKARRQSVESPYASLADTGETELGAAVRGLFSPEGYREEAAAAAQSAGRTVRRMPRAASEGYNLQGNLLRAGQAAFTGEDIGELIKEADRIGKRQASTEEGVGPIGQAVLGAVRLGAGQWARNVQDGLLTAAGVGLAAGGVQRRAAVPAAKFAFKARLAYNSYMMAVGDIYMDGIRDGLQPRAARIAAAVGAVPYGALDYLQMTRAAKAFGRIGGAISPARQAVPRGVARRVLASLGRTGLETVWQAMSEGGQEAVKALANASGAYFDGNVELAGKVFGKAGDEGVREFTETLPTFLAMHIVPGMFGAVGAASPARKTAEPAAPAAPAAQPAQPPTTPAPAPVQPIAVSDTAPEGIGQLQWDHAPADLRARLVAMLNSGVEVEKVDRALIRWIKRQPSVTRQTPQEAPSEQPAPVPAQPPAAPPAPPSAEEQAKRAMMPAAANAVIEGSDPESPAFDAEAIARRAIDSALSEAQEVPDAVQERGAEAVGAQPGGAEGARRPGEGAALGQGVPGAAPAGEGERGAEAEAVASDVPPELMPPNEWKSWFIDSVRKIAGIPNLTIPVSDSTHVEAIGWALDIRSPVSAAAVDAYGIKLPEGYVRDGDRYVYRPEEPGAPAAGVAPASTPETREQKPWELAKEAVKPYVDGIPKMSNAQLKAEEKRLAAEINQYGYRGSKERDAGSQEYFETSEKFAAIGMAIARRPSSPPELLTPAEYRASVPGDEPDKARANQLDYVREATKKRKPVNAEAFGLLSDPPANYVRVGNNYVYRPEAPAAAGVTPVSTPEAQEPPISAEKPAEIAAPPTTMDRDARVQRVVGFVAAEVNRQDEKYAKKHPDPRRPYQPRPVSTFVAGADRLIKMIDAKDADGLRDWLARPPGQNDGSKRAFETETGIKLAKTARDISKQIDDWAGVSAEERASRQEAKNRAFDAKQADTEVEYAARNLGKLQVKVGGDTYNAKEFIDRKFATGFNRVVRIGQRGAAPIYGLLNAENAHFTLPNPDILRYARALERQAQFGRAPTKTEPPKRLPERTSTGDQRPQEPTAPAAPPPAAVEPPEATPPPTEAPPSRLPARASAAETAPVAPVSRQEPPKSATKPAGLKTPQESLRGANVGDIVTWRTATGEDVDVNWRGMLRDDQAVVVTPQGIQITVPAEQLRAKGAPYTGTTVAEPPATATTKAPAASPDTLYKGYKIRAAPETRQLARRSRGKDVDRRVGGFFVTEPDGYERHFLRKQDAVQWIDAQVAEGITKPGEIAVTTDAAGDKTVSVPSKDKPGLPPKEQKKYLLAELDRAIAEAPEEEGPGPDPARQEAANAEMKALTDRVAALDAEAAAVGEAARVAAEAEKEAVKAAAEAKGEDWIEAVTNLPDPWKAEEEASRAWKDRNAERYRAAWEPYNRLLQEIFDLRSLVTIEVPGDGTFRIPNTKDALREFAKRVQKSFPTTPAKPDSVGRKPMLSQPGIVPVGKVQDWNGADPETRKLLEPFVSQDGTRGVIQQVHWNKETGEVVGVDGRRLAVLVANKGAKPKNAKEGWGRKTERGEFPNYGQVFRGYRPGQMPDIDPGDLRLTVDTEPLIRKLREAQGVLTDKINSVRLLLRPTGVLDVLSNAPDVGEFISGEGKHVALATFNPEYLLDALNFLRKTGAEKVELVGHDGYYPTLLLGKSAYVVTMPLRGGDSADPSANWKASFERLQRGEEPLTGKETKAERRAKREAQKAAPAAEAPPPAEPVGETWQRAFRDYVSQWKAGDVHNYSDLVNRARAAMQGGMDAAEVVGLVDEAKIEGENRDFVLGQLKIAAETPAQAPRPEPKPAPRRLPPRAGDASYAPSAPLRSVRPTPAQDAEYLAAVGRGDMETAQRMVDEAAKKAGYNTKAYHGSPVDNITEFSEQATAHGYYFSPDPNTAGYYTGGSRGGRLYAVMLNMGNTADLTDDVQAGRIIDDLLGGPPDFLMDAKKTDERGELIEANESSVYAVAEEAFKSLATGKQQAALSRLHEQYPGINKEPLSSEWTLRDALDYDQVDVDAVIKAFDGIDNSLKDRFVRVNEDAERAKRDIGTSKFYGSSQNNQQNEMIRFAENSGYDSVIFPDPSSTGDAVSYVVFDAKRIKSADAVTRDDSGRVIPLSERFDPATPDIRYAPAAPLRSARDGQQDTLVALHNLSAENLMHADKLGGIPVPSIAITRPDIPFNSFGDITLVGTRDMVDPLGRHPVSVFNADAWTTRHPDVVWAKVLVSKAQPIMDRVRKAQEDTGDHRFSNEIWDYMVNRPDKNKALDRAKTSTAAKLQFLRENGRDAKTVMRDIEPRRSISKDAEVIAFLRAHPDVFGARMEDDIYREAQVVLKAAIERVIQKDARGNADLEQMLRNGYEHQVLNEEGDVAFGIFDRIWRDADNVGKREIDEEATKRAVEAKLKAMPDGEQKFLDWVEALLNVYRPPMVRVRGRLQPYSLDSIVEAMTTLSVRGREESMAFGDSKARGASAKKLRSVSEMHAEEKILKTKKAQKEYIEKVQRPLMETFRESAASMRRSGLEGSSGFLASSEVFDDAMKAIADYLKGGSVERSPGRMRRALARNYFRGFEEWFVEEALDAAHALADAPSDYFEAKPLRGVPLSEFIGAVVPNDASQAVVDVLERNGIRRIERYDGYNEDQRAAAVRRISDQGGVRFAPSARLSPGGFFSALTRAVTSLPDGFKSPGDQFARALEGRRNKGQPWKQQEADETGFADWLKMQQENGKPVTKADALAFLEQNGVRVETVRKSADKQVDIVWSEDENGEWHGQDDQNIFSGEWLIRADEGSGEWKVFHPTSELLVDSFRKLEAAKAFVLAETREASESAVGSPGNTKFSQYAPPGGVPGSYREVLLTVPVAGSKGWTIEQTSWGSFDLYRPDGSLVDAYKTRDAAERALKSLSGGAETGYRSSHWSEPNVIAHMLMDERRIPLDVLEKTLPELAAKLRAAGKTEARALHMIEGQSDLHQTGAAKGYNQGPTQAWKVRAEGDKWRVFNSISQEQGDLYARQGLAQEVAAGFNATRAELQRDSGVPSLPMRGDAWKRLVLRKMLAEAADGGYDLVTWSTGEDRFKKWGSQRVDWKVASADTGKRKVSTYRVVDNGLPGGRPLFDVENAKGETVSGGYSTRERAEQEIAILQRHASSGWTVSAQEQSGGEHDGQNIEALARERGVLLEQHGKTVRTKEDLRRIIESIKRGDDTNVEKLTGRIWERMQTEPEGTSLPRKEFFEFLYDKSFVNEANDILRKMGREAKVGQALFQGGGPEPYGDGTWLVRLSDGRYLDEEAGRLTNERGAAYEFSTEQEAREAWKQFESDSALSFHAIPITDAMRSAVAQGQPYYAPAAQPSRLPQRALRATLNATGAMRRIASGDYNAEDIHAAVAAVAAEVPPRLDGQGGYGDRPASLLAEDRGVPGGAEDAAGLGPRSQGFRSDPGFSAASRLADRNGITAVPVESMPGDVAAASDSDNIYLAPADRPLSELAVHEIGHVLMRRNNRAVSALVEAVKPEALEYWSTWFLSKETYRNSMTQRALDELGPYASAEALSNHIDRQVAVELACEFLTGGNELAGFFAGNPYALRAEAIRAVLAVEGPATAGRAEGAGVRYAAEGRPAAPSTGPPVTADQDRAYLAAVEAGDTATAQRMVDEAAKKAGYNVGPVWHGTDADIRQFQVPFGEWQIERMTHHPLGVYAAEAEDVAALFGARAMRLVTKGRVVDVTAATDAQSTLSPLGVTIPRHAYDYTHRDKPISWFGGQYKLLEDHVRDADVARLRQDGIGAIRIWDRTRGRSHPTLVMLDPSQIKSADAVTRDDSGRVVPLSERFNQRSQDIRFAPAESPKSRVPPRLSEFTPKALAAERTARLLQGRREATQDVREALAGVRPAMQEARRKGVPVRASEALRGLAEDRDHRIRETEVTLNKVASVVSLGEKATAKDIREAQGAMRKFINDHMPREELKRNEWRELEKDVIATQTAADIEKIAPKVVDLADRANRRILTTAIKGLWNKIRHDSRMAVDIVKEVMDLLEPHINEGKLVVRGPDAATRAKAARLRAEAAVDRAIFGGAFRELKDSEISALRSLAVKPLSEMSTDELRDLRDKLAGLQEMGRFVLKARRAVRRSRADAAAEAVAGSLTPADDFSLRRDVNGLSWAERFRNRWQQKMGTWNWHKNNVSPADSIFMDMQGSRSPEGAVMQTFKRPVDVADGRWAVKYADLVTETREKVKELDIDPERQELIGVHAIMQQETGEQKLINSGYDQAQLHSLPELTANETEFLNWMRGKMDALTDDLKRIALYYAPNADFKKVELYFPFMTDWEYLQGRTFKEMFSDEDGQLVPIKAGASTTSRTTHTPQGFMQERVGAGRQPVQTNALRVFLTHMNHVLYYIEMEPALRDMNLILANENLRKAMGPERMVFMHNWMDTVARHGGTESAYRWPDLENLVSLVGAAKLAYKLPTALVQTTPIILGLPYNGAYQLRAAVQVPGSYTLRQWIYANSPEVRFRMGNDPAYDANAVQTILRSIVRSGFYPLVKIDRLAASITWFAAYNDFMAKAGKPVDITKPADPDGAYHADVIMRRVNASQHGKDMPALLSRGSMAPRFRQRSIARAAFQFQNPLFFVSDLVRRDVLEGSQGLAFAVFVALTWLAANAWETAMRRFLRRHMQPDTWKNRQKYAGAAERLLREQLSNANVDESRDWANLFMDYGQQTLGNIPGVMGLQGFSSEGRVGMPVVDTVHDVWSGTAGLFSYKPGERRHGAEKAARAAIGGLVPGGSAALQVKEMATGERDLWR